MKSCRRHASGGLDRKWTFRPREKSAIRVLNTPFEPKRRQTRARLLIYDEASRGAVMVLWEASDRVCGKRLKALLRILLPALERNSSVKPEPEICGKIPSTIDRFAPNTEEHNI
jgi:hypothetical protein